LRGEKMKNKVASLLKKIRGWSGGCQKKKKKVQAGGKNTERESDPSPEGEKSAETKREKWGCGQVPLQQGIKDRKGKQRKAGGGDRQQKK